jgi:outer membrane protein
MTPGISLNPPEPNDMEQWVEASYVNSQQVKIALDNLALAAKEVDRARYGHFPTLDAVASANYNNQGDSQFNSGVATTQGVVALQFAIPLYSGGALSSRVREAVANRTKADQDLENARRTVAQAVREAFILVNTGLSRSRP